MLLKYEILKIRKLSLFAFMVCLALNFVAAFFSAAAPAADVKTAKEYYSVYERSPEEINSRFNEYDFSQDIELLQANPDYYCIKNIIDRQKYILQYDDDMRTVLFHAKVVMSEVPENSYMYRYEREVINRYTKLYENNKLTVSYIRGWDEYFKYSLQNVFMLLSVLFLSVYLFAEDLSMRSILRDCKRNSRAVCAKLIVLLGGTMLFALLITLTTLEAFQLKTGFAGGGAPIQQIAEFEYLPYKFTIFGFAAVQTFIRIFGLYIFAVIAGILVLLTHSAIISLIASVGICGLNIFAFNSIDISGTEYTHFLNLWTFLESKSIFYRFFSYKIFEYAADGLFCVFVIGLLLLFVLAGLSIFLYLKRTASRLRIFNFSIKSIRKTRIYKQRTYPQNLTAYEILKLCTYRVLIPLVIILTLSKVFYTGYLYDNYYEKDDIFHLYIEKIGGEITEEKNLFMFTERQRIDDILTQKDTITEQYKDGVIEEEQYRGYMREYWNAFVSDDAFSEIEDYYRCLKAHDNGGFLIYDKAYTLFFRSFPDSILCLVILLITLVLFTVDVTSGMDNITRATRNGRNTILKHKYITCVGASLLFIILFSLIDISCLYKYYGSESLSAPISSIRTFAGVSVHINIIWSDLLFLLFRCLCYIVAACLLSVPILYFQYKKHNYIKKRRIGMKKVFSLTLLYVLMMSICFSFMSCSSEQKYIKSGNSNDYLYAKPNDVIYKYNIENGYAVPLCEDPLCKHDSDSCPFYGASDEIYKHDDYIIYFKGNEINKYNIANGKVETLLSAEGKIYYPYMIDDRIYYNAVNFNYKPDAEHTSIVNLYYYDMKTFLSVKLNDSELYDMQHIDGLEDGKLLWYDDGLQTEYTTDLEYKNVSDYNEDYCGIVAGEAKYRLEVTGVKPMSFNLYNMSDDGTKNIAVRDVVSVKGYNGFLLVTHNRTEPKLIGQEKTDDGKIQDIYEYQSNKIYKYTSDGKSRVLLCTLPDGYYIYSLSSAAKTLYSGNYIGILLKGYNFDSQGYVTGYHVLNNIAIINIETGKYISTVSN
ncbi:MAG: hypothetical protein VB118_01355 [Oscillospiraceae bacterium]|nr:hypothetical protein [Oscillospiraceae bacterium]